MLCDLILFADNFSQLDMETALLPKSENLLLLPLPTFRHKLSIKLPE